MTLVVLIWGLAIAYRFSLSISDRVLREREFFFWEKVVSWDRFSQEIMGVMVLMDMSIRTYSFVFVFTTTSI